MLITLKHTLFKSFTILIVMSLLAPSVVKIGHAFENHKHEVCLDNSNEHFHALDLDCEFYKFNISNQLLIPDLQYKITFIDSYSSTENFGLYHFKYNHQPLYFSLRGPPQLIV